MPETENSSNLATTIATITELKGETKTVTPSTSQQTVSPSSGKNGITQITVNAVTSSIDSDIVAGNIKSGVNILGVSGSLTELKGETRSVSLTNKNGQTYTPTSSKNGITSITVTPNNKDITITPERSQLVRNIPTGYSGYGNITVNAVTSSIDSNIAAENIKDGVTILGVTGSYSGGVTPTGTLTIASNGIYDVTNYASADVCVSGGSDSGGRFLIQVIDYDGTVLKSDHLDENDTFTFPSNPSHTGLTFQGWSSPVTITNGTITVPNSDITIGAVYTTTSGLSEFDIELTDATGLNVTLNMNGTKDWGDGIIDTSTTHTYQSVGNYTVTCNGTTITSSNMSGLFGQSLDLDVQNFYVRNIRFAAISTIPNNALEYCCSLKSITIPNGVTTIGDCSLRNCSLKSITLPSSVTSIGDFAFTECYPLNSITMPGVLTNLGQYVFNGCFNLKIITIPAGISSIGEFTFGNIIELNTLTIPGSVTSIGLGSFCACYTLTSVIFNDGISYIDSSAFESCSAVMEYDFTNLLSVPTLLDAGAFGGINGLCKIKVPQSLYNSWITASNWMDYADYIEGV